MRVESDNGQPLTDALQAALAACRTGFGAAIAFSFGVSALMLVAPIYMLQVYNRVLVSRSIETLVVLTLIVGISLLVLGVLDLMRSLVMIRISAWLDRKLAPALFSASVTSAVKPGVRPSVQSLRDLAAVRNFLSSPLLFAFFDAPWTPMFLVVTFMLHWLLGAVALIGAIVLLAIAVANELMTRRDLDAAGGLAMRDLNQAEMTVRNADAVVAMGMLPALADRWYGAAAETDLAHSRAAGRGAVFTAASKMLRLGLQVAVLGIGAFLVIRNELSPGAIIAASILTTRALAPVEQTIGGWRQAMSARSSYFRLRQLLMSVPPTGDIMPLPRPRGLLSAEVASYIFPGSAEPTLRDVSFVLEAGESLAIIGPSAAGKTTLARLLVGNLPPWRGHIRLDGADMTQLNAEDRSRYVGFLPQDIELFDGTVRENIARMADGEAERVTAAALASGVHEMILRLPKGYETEIGPGGVALSGGQRQRIGLARAFYGDPSLVVLDEPNANLDQAGEAALVEAIRKICDRQATLVIVTHAAAIIRHVDKVLVLADGRVRHFGPRDEVLAKIAAVPARMAPARTRQEA